MEGMMKDAIFDTFFFHQSVVVLVLNPIYLFMLNMQKFVGLYGSLRFLKQKLLMDLYET